MKRSSFEQELPALLDKLEPDTKAAWGLMTPQHMVEHLIITWKISRGRVQVPLSSDKALDKKQAWLMTDEPYQRNIEIPGLQGKLAPLRFPDLETAKAALLEEVKLFHAYYDEKPEARHINPIFGEINREQWHQLHFKHVRHHFTQFGLLD